MTPKDYQDGLIALAILQHEIELLRSFMKQEKELLTGNNDRNAEMNNDIKSIIDDSKKMYNRIFKVLS